MPTTTATTNGVATDQPALVAPTVEELNAKIARLQQRLEQIYGPEKVVAWLEEGEPLPEVRADPPGTIRFRGTVGGPRVVRKKDSPSQVVVPLTSRLRNTPIKELADLSEEAEMEIKISPRALQAGLPLAFGGIAPDGEDIETNISDETLRARLTSLSSRTGLLPEGWETWDQERKDQVGRWAWAMILQASDNEIKLPPVAYEIEEWYWGPEAMAARTPFDGETFGDDNPPPKLRDEDAEKIRNSIASAVEEGDDTEDQEKQPARKPARKARRRNGRS